MTDSKLRIGGAVVYWRLSAQTSLPTLAEGLKALGLEQCIPEPRTPLSCLRGALVDMHTPTDKETRLVVRPIRNELRGFVVVAERPKAHAHEGDDWGPPGVGKSSIVRQSAETLGLQVCDVRAVLLDPVDLRGIPAVNGDHRAHWCQPDFLPRDGQGVLFLDELAQAPPLVQSACLQLTLDRKIGEYTLPDGWTVIAASNRQEDRAGAHKLISPLLNRFVHLDLEVSVDDWQAWALAANVAPDVRAFLRFRPGLLFSFDPAAGARAFPTPRTWEFVSQVAPVTPDLLLLPVVSGCIGEGPAAEFIAFRRLYTQLPDPSTVLSNPQGTTVPTDPAVLYALAGALVEKARAASDPQLNALGIFAGRLPTEYATLLVRDTIAVNPRCCSQPSVNAWVRAHADLFARN